MSAQPSNVVSLLLRKGTRDPDAGVVPQPLRQPWLVPEFSDGFYQLKQEWSYVWRDDRLRHKVIVPCWNESDGASIPRLAWSLAGITPDGLIRAAALFHDHLYDMRGFPPLYFQAEPNSEQWRRVRRQFTRSEADKLFHQIMREAGVGSVKSWLAYRGVRMFGWRAW